MGRCTDQGIGNEEIDTLHAHDGASREVWGFSNAWRDRVRERPKMWYWRSNTTGSGTESGLRVRALLACVRKQQVIHLHPATTAPASAQPIGTCAFAVCARSKILPLQSKHLPPFLTPLHSLLKLSQRLKSRDDFNKVNQRWTACVVTCTWNTKPCISHSILTLFSWELQKSISETYLLPKPKSTYGTFFWARHPLGFSTQKVPSHRRMARFGLTLRPLRGKNSIQLLINLKR